MKQLAFLCSLLVLSTAFAQNSRPNDAYKAEDDGYFSNLIPTEFGMIATSNNGNEIFLIANGELKTLMAAPGCGRYMQMSPDGKMIGFKFIDSTGLQCPAMLDLSTQKISFLAEPASLCGQPAFSANGDLLLPTQNGFNIRRSSGNTDTYNTGEYVNFMALSPDGKQVIYNNANDELMLMNTDTKTVTNISPEGCALPDFSYDGRFVAFVSSMDRIMIFSVESNSMVAVFNGRAPQWHPTQNVLAYALIEQENYFITSGEIKTYDAISNTHTTIAGGMGQKISGPAFSHDGNLFWHSIAKPEIFTLSDGQISTLYLHEGLLPRKSFQQLKGPLANTTVPGIVPYVHQVYDTPSWHAGWGSCAPTTSIMAVAYYNRLPEWPTSVDHGYSWDPHVNNFGSYVADRYRFNEWYYSETADAYSTTAYGGYGYMWTGSYSPNSRMSDYIEQHYMTSNQYWTTSCTWAATVGEIDNGYVHPICNYLTASGHLTLCIGYVQGQHTLVFNDPYGDRNLPSYPNYYGDSVLYDWPGYNNGYSNLGGSNSYVAWTVAARTTEPVYSDTIIDNNYYGHGFYMNNSTLGSNMRYYRDFNTGYNGHTWFTLGMATSPDICYTTWEPNIPDTALYRVSVFVPSKGSSTTNAMYHISRVGTDTIVTVNQNTHKNMWVELGVFSLAPGAAMVYLGDSTGTDGDSIAFDAVKFSKIPMPVASFTANQTQICPGDTVVFTSASQNASTLQWFPNGGNIISQVGNQCTAVFAASGQYDVTLVAQNGNGSDTLEQLQYINVGFNATSLFDVSDDTVYLNDPVVLFFNNSQNAVSYQWNFGDGSQSSDANPYHLYSATGNYEVALMANSAECKSDTSFQTIVVMPISAIDDHNMSTIHLYPNPAGEFISTNLSFDGETKYIITETSGRVVLQGILPAAENTISLKNLSQGAYIITFENGDIILREMFVKK